MKTIVNLILKVASRFLDEDPQPDGFVYWKGPIVVSLTYKLNYDNAIYMESYSEIYTIQIGSISKSWTFRDSTA